MMAPFKRVSIFSDLHLTSPSAPLYRAFLKAIDSSSSANEAVVLAGDIFEILVGDSSFFKEKYCDFFDQVRTVLARGVSVFYIEGNHDFHLRGLFPPGVQFRDPEVQLPVVSKSKGVGHLLVSHGDLVDLSDRGYLLMRAALRSRPVQGLAQALPGSWIEWIAGRMARDAQRKVDDLPEQWSLERRESLRRIFREFAYEKHRQGADFIVLGHCHDLDEFGGFYWNMGYPPVHRQFLVYDSDLEAQKEVLTRRYFLGV